jgi:hypothetical protein
MDLDERAERLVTPAELAELLAEQAEREPEPVPA